MGTRGAYGFYAEGEAKVSYNHSDSYPCGLGSNVLEFVKETPDIELAEIAARVKPVDSDAKPTAKQLAGLGDWYNPDEAGGERGTWYNAIRSVQGDLRAFRDGLDYMLDSATFLYDSLFCEWAYLVNTDTGTLEVYKGFNTDPKAAGRYAKVPSWHRDDSEYAGVKLICTLPFELIRSIDNVGAIAGILESVVEYNEDDDTETEKSMDQLMTEIWELGGLAFKKPLHFRQKRFADLPVGATILSRKRTLEKVDEQAAVDESGEQTPFLPEDLVIVKEDFSS